MFSRFHEGVAANQERRMAFGSCQSMLRHSYRNANFLATILLAAFAWEGGRATARISPMHGDSDWAIFERRSIVGDFVHHQ
jgi:hypothetical protein